MRSTLGLRPRFLRLLSWSRFRPSRGRAGVSLGLDGCEVRPCDPCARVRPCVPCVLCVSRLPPVSFYRYSTDTPFHTHLLRQASRRIARLAPLTSEHAQTVCRDHTGSESPKQASVKQQERHMRLHEPSPLLALRGGSGGSAPVTLIAAALAATKSAHPVEASDSSDNVVATLIG